MEIGSNGQSGLNTDWLSPVPPSATTTAKKAGGTVPPPSSAPPGSTPPAVSTPTTSGPTGASEMLGGLQTLAAYGFSPAQQQTLTNWYNSELAAGESQDKMNNDLWTSSVTKPIMQQAFPGIVAQQEAGVPTMSIPDYLTFEQDMQSLGSQLGLPAGFISSADIGKMVAGGITVSDLTQRVTDAKNAAATVAANNPQTAQLLDQWYGVKPGDGTLAAYFLDPTKTEALLQTQYTAANIGGGLEQAGFTQVDKNQLQALAGQGVSASPSQAASAAKLLPATTPLAHQADNGETITQQQAIAATLGGPGAGAAQLAVSGAEAARISKFAGGGGFGTGQQGATGAGAASE